MNEELLLRFLTKTCSQEELLEVENWIAADQANAKWLFGMEDIWSLKDELRYSNRKEIDAAYRRFVGRTKSVAKPKEAITRQLYHGWMKYAAVITIVFLLAANIFQSFRGKSSDNIATNTVEVPVGQRVSITLADGTKVWLNSGSVLTYLTKFDLKNRTVRLDGEGYFEVKADRENPFVVNTSMLEVSVIGTKFNVQAYPGDDIAVSLLEGQLHVQSGEESVLMKASELVTWSKTSGLAHHKNSEVQHKIQWTSGELMFVDEPLANIAKTLERQFGVTIIIETSKLADEHFTCHTQQNASLEQVLDLLKATKKLNYSFNRHTVYIK